MTRVILISSHDAPDADLKAILSASSRLRVTELSIENAQRAFDRSAGDIVIVNISHLGEDEHQLLASLKSQTGDLPMVVVSPQLQSDEMRRLLRVGIEDWLPTPVSANDLIDAIRNGTKTRRSNPNTVHAIVSVVGGAGASTIALTLADVLAERSDKTGQSVALFDLDFSLGNCATYANVQNDFRLSKVAANPRRIDPEFLRAIQKKHEEGFFLYSFKEPELNSDINSYELVLRLLDAVSAEHGITVLDIPYYMTEWREDVLAAVNSCTLVTELNLAAIKHTIDAIAKFKAIRGDNIPINVVFNKWESHLFGQRVGRKQIKELLGDVPVYHLPKDEVTISEAIDRGLLPALVKKQSKFVKAVRKYAKQLQTVVAE